MQRIFKIAPQPIILLLAVLAVFSCKKDNDDEGFPITNDLRVLKVYTGGDAVTSGISDVSVAVQIELVFSHALNTTAFENALNISPSAEFSASYDDSGSFATISFDLPLQYETGYTLSLPKGAYGTNGEASLEDFSFTFTTRSFTAPNITLTSDVPGFFEGETITITAELSFPIFNDVTLDLVFSGTADNGVDYSASAPGMAIPAGSTVATVELAGLDDGEDEGSETINISIANLLNAVESQPQMLNLTLGDQPPPLEFKGAMSLKIGGTTTNGRAIHIRALQDIPDLSLYGIGIANNGGGTDGREIDFPATSAAAGDDILLVRDQDLAGLAAYFGDYFNDFEVVVETPDLNFNGDDPFEL